MIESLKQKGLEEYKNYKILGIGEGGGHTGPGDFPVSEGFGAVAEKIRKGASYFSLEKLEKGRYFFPGEREPAFKEMHEKYLERAKLEKNKNRHFILGDACLLPLKDSSIDEIWIENVFSDPSSSSEYHWLAIASIGEAARVLKKGGYLYVFNDNTPDVAYFLKDMDFEESGLTKTVFTGESLRAFLTEQKLEPSRMAHAMSDRLAEHNKPFAIVYKKV